MEVLTARGCVMSDATNFGTVTAWDDTGAEIGRAAVYRTREWTFVADIPVPYSCRFGRAEWYLPAAGHVFTCHKTDVSMPHLCMGSTLTMTVDADATDPFTRAVLKAMLADLAGFTADGPDAGGSWRDRPPML